MSQDRLSQFAGTWLLLDSGPGEPAWNMALDEALLESAAQRTEPVLRFYSWTTPAATFGYFQPYEQVARWTSVRPLVRRPTGGGLVLHIADWTYSLVFPRAHPWYALRAMESYRQLHHWLQTAFLELGIRSDLASEPRKEHPGQCFAGPERFDLVWAGRKMAGAAQRRTRHGLLIQGSVQPAQAWDRTAWQTALASAAQRLWGASWTQWQPPEPILSRAQQLADQKYSQPAYNQRR
jgi:lipoate-protein ligase A